MTKYTTQLINAIKSNKWSMAKKLLKSKLDWTLKVDLTNGIIHHLAYHQSSLLKSIPSDIVPNLILQPNSEGDTIAHIAAKLRNIELLKWCIKTNTNIIYQLNALGCTPLFYIISQIDDLRKVFSINTNIIDHQISPDYTFLEYLVLHLKSIDLITFFLKHTKLSTHSKGLMCTVIDSDLSVKLQTKLLSLLHQLDLSYSDLN